MDFIKENYTHTGGIHIANVLQQFLEEENWFTFLKLLNLLFPYSMIKIRIAEINEEEK